MPGRTRSLTLVQARRFVAEHAFTAPPPVPPGNVTNGVGIELEWFPLPRRAPDTLRAMVRGALPGGSSVTFEPGGQLELSGPRQPGIAAACSCMRADTAMVRGALAPYGIELEGIGLDPRGARPRVVDSARYR